MKQALGYVRVSTDEQTVENQKLSIMTYANNNGYHVQGFITDESVSGKIPALERHGFSNVILSLHSGRYDAVLVYDLSRIGRTFWDTLEAIKAIEKFNIPLISCSPKESFLQTTDPNLRKLLISILTWVAEREREVLVQRTKDGLNRAKQSGKILGRPRKNIKIATVIKLRSEGKTIEDIAKILNVSRATLYNQKCIT